MFSTVFSLVAIRDHTCFVWQDIFLNSNFCRLLRIPLHFYKFEEHEGKLLYIFMRNRTFSFQPVLRIHDIFLCGSSDRIRIWIRGSMPLTNGSGCGSGSCYFSHWPSRCQQKIEFLLNFFAFYFLKVHLYHFQR